MVIATPQKIPYTLTETKMPEYEYPFSHSPAFSTLTPMTPPPAAQRERDYYLECSSPIRPAYSKSTSNSDLWSLSTVLLKPFQYLKCQPRRTFETQVDNEGHTSKLNRNASQNMIIQSKVPNNSNSNEIKPTPVTFQNFESYWKKQIEFLDQLLVSYQEKKVILDRDATTKDITPEYSADMERLQTEFQQVLMQEIQNLRKEFVDHNIIDSETIQTLHKYYSEISNLVSQQDDKIHALQTNYMNESNKQQETVILDNEFIKEAKNMHNEVQGTLNTLDEQMRFLNNHLKELGDKFRTLENEFNSQVQSFNIDGKSQNSVRIEIEDCKNIIHRLSSSQSDHVALILSLQSRIKSLEAESSSKYSNDLENRVKELEAIISKCNLVQSIEVTPNKQEVPSRGRSNSQKSSKAQNEDHHIVTSRQRKRAVSICAPSTPRSTPIRYDSTSDNQNIPKSLLTTLRKDSLSHNQAIIDMKKEMQQMKKIMNTWRIENKTTKDIVSKTKNQYELLEGKVNVLASRTLNQESTQVA